jgi:uncharacterized protein with HEPN domain
MASIQSSLISLNQKFNMSKRSSPELLIEDIIKSAEKILKYTTGVTFEEFEINDLLIDAVIRNFEIIGEAANRLPEDFKEKHNHIEWYRIRGFRNRIVHDYAGIDNSIVWSIIEEFVPIIIDSLKTIGK